MLLDDPAYENNVTDKFGLFFAQRQTEIVSMRAPKDCYVQNPAESNTFPMDESWSNTAGFWTSIYILYKIGPVTFRHALSRSVQAQQGRESGPPHDQH